MATVHHINPLAGLPRCTQCNTQHWTRIEPRPETVTFTDISPEGIGEPVTEESWNGHLKHECENGHEADSKTNADLLSVSAELARRGMVGPRPGGAQVWPFVGGNCIGDAWNDEELRSELHRLQTEGVDLDLLEVVFLDERDEVVVTYRGPQVSAWLRGELPSPAYYQSVIG